MDACIPSLDSDLRSSFLSFPLRDARTLSGSTRHVSTLPASVVEMQEENVLRHAETTLASGIFVFSTCVDQTFRVVCGGYQRVGGCGR